MVNSPTGEVKGGLRLALEAPESMDDDDPASHHSEV